MCIHFVVLLHRAGCCDCMLTCGIVWPLLVSAKTGTQTSQRLLLNKKIVECEVAAIMPVLVCLLCWVMSDNSPAGQAVSVAWCTHVGNFGQLGHLMVPRKLNSCPRTYNWCMNVWSSGQFVICIHTIVMHVLAYALVDVCPCQD